MPPPPAIVAAAVAQPQAQHFALELTAAPSRFRPLPPPLRRRSYQATQPLLSSRTRLRSEEHTSELQSRLHLVCRLLLEKKKPPPSSAILTDPVRIETWCSTDRSNHILSMIALLNP